MPLHPREIRRLVLRMLHILAPQGADVELVFVRDGAIMDLNRRYLGLRGPTNSLAFPDAGRAGALPGGSLFVSLDALRRECLLYGQAPAAHLGRLLAHGLAHLAGFEHGDGMDAVCAALAQVWQRQG
ncbi:MAG: rRNA maturation RNase YbeY [Deltaproteobacteria bacterium]|nr:rRNA maturation RNase YbeY [Deltaproteobacteria bacterium]